MKVEKLICNSINITYDKGYIALWLEMPALPDMYSLSGEVFQIKSSFHISLLCVKNISDVESETETRILDLFCKFTQANKIFFESFTNDLRLVTDDMRNRKSIILMCDVSNLKKFILYISEQLDIEIPMQPTHVTLYTLGTDMGIGVSSFQKLEEKSVSIENSELIQIIKSLK